jgi:hypothetical protein
MTRQPDPLLSKEKSKRRIPLETDPIVIKELMQTLSDNGWMVELETSSLLFKKEGARLIYLRRLNILQIYWAGYGTQAIEALVADFDSAEDIIVWSDQLHGMELIQPSSPFFEDDEEDEDDVYEYDEKQPLAHLSPADIIRSIFS